MDTNLINRDVFGSQEIAYECLADYERTENFYNAINGLVKNESRVIELGTGTGILALFAAKAGAKKVDAFEISIPMAEIARKNVADNSLQDIITIKTKDVTTMDIDEGRYDIFIAEMISVGLIEEQLVPAFNNVLRQGLLKDTAIAIPRVQDTFVELINSDFNHFGVKMNTIQIEQTWQNSKLQQTLSRPKLISHVDFNEAIKSGNEIESTVDRVVEFEVVKTGTVNAIRLTSDSILSDKIVSGWTQCMNSPAIIPINNVQLTQGQIFKLRISYEMGGEMKSVNIEQV